MMKRRSFLAMLGLGASAATTVAKAAIPAAVEAAPLAVAETVATTAVTVPTYMVRMPVSVSLTQEQVDLCSAWNMSPVEYAKNLLDLKQEGKIEAEVSTSLNMEVQREMERIAVSK
jgi:hypothetical protein